MNNKKLRIYLAMFLALILVTQTKNIVTLVSRQDFKAIFASLGKPPTQPQLPEGGIVFDRITPPPTPSPFFAPTTPPTPTLIPRPTDRLVPTRATLPTAMPTRLPTRIPTKAPIGAPTTVPTKGPAQGGSKSKLSEFMIGRYTAGAKAILEANPPLVKVIQPWTDNAFYEAIRAYKARVPGGIAVVRFYDGTPGLYYAATTDPSASAQDFYDKVINPGMAKLGGNKSLFDYLATPNEFENVPDWRGEGNVKWNGSFWHKLTDLTAAAGMRLCVGSIPVGNIEAPDLGFIIDDLRAMKQAGAAFCYHGYTNNLSTDVGHEIWYSLRYRQYYDYFKANAPDLADMPLILGEGGVAGDGDPYAGYLKYGGAEKFKPWLQWYDSEIRKDAYVRGVTLFQIGNNSDWGAFNLEPISGWMADYLRSQK